MTDSTDKKYTLTLDQDELCIAVAAQCAGIQKVIEMNEYTVAHRYKNVTDSFVRQAKEQGLDVVLHVMERANEEREANANADD